MKYVKYQVLFSLKKYLRMSSAAVMNDALRANIPYFSLYKLIVHFSGQGNKNFTCPA